MKATEKQAKKVKKKLPLYYKVGRPTKYKKIFCKRIVDYFDIPPVVEKMTIVYNKDGEAYEKLVTSPNPIPIFDMFAMEVCNVDRTTLHNWCKEHPEFFLAYKKAQSLQKKMLLYQCSYGLITPSYAVFLTKALTDLNDVTNVDIKSAGEKVESFNLTTYLKELKDKDIDGLQREAQKQTDN